MTLLRIINFLLAVAFLLFAFVQVNDPDPVVWILIYGSMAVLCILAMFRIYPRKLIIAAIVIFAGYSVMFWSGVRTWLQQDSLGVLVDDVAKMEHPYIEQAREFLGLMICLIVLMVLLAQSLRKIVS